MQAETDPTENKAWLRSNSTRLLRWDILQRHVYGNHRETPMDELSERIGAEPSYGRNVLHLVRKRLHK